MPDDSHDPTSERRGSTTLVSALSTFALRDGRREVALHEGETLIGRGSDCALVLDGALVSRRHAIVRVEGTRVTVTDLGSRNGTAVNGRRISDSVELFTLDRMLVGNVELQLVERVSNDDDVAISFRRAETTTLEALPSTEPAPGFEPLSGGSDENTSSGHTLNLLSGVVDKLLALKKTTEAVRLLEAPIDRIWDEAKRGHSVDREAADRAADYAVRLAEVTEDDSWVVKALDIFLGQERPLPLPVIDRLYALIRRLPRTHRRRLDAFVDDLRNRREQLTAAERFALKRLEGLIRLASL